ncbi:MAG: DegT/DnrJ/EryC1/StrS family aminotransferase [Candidatus Fermentibacteria bacterium]|nr:DegT/DnrJ/EryC1/StrS family aminotransferase [Candidatus Fermentibacteria bacterium]
MIRVFKPSYDNRELEAVAEVMRSGWVGLGPKTAEFEQAFASFCGVEYCVGLNSGTAAINMALSLLGIGKGDEVIIPTITFVSAAHCIISHGAEPVFADVNQDTLNMDLTDMQSKITSKTRAIMPVHFGGLPVRMDELITLAEEIPVIEDCAHAAGTRYKGQHVGGMGDVGCFSFHAVKNIAMGEGGAVILKNKSLAERAKKRRWLGIDRETWDRTSLDRSYWWEYSVTEIGVKAHMDDIHAAIGLVQLEKLEEANDRRRKITHLYRQGLRDINQLEMPPEETDDIQSSWHIFHVKAEKRDELNLYLNSMGISTGVHYKPLHLYACYGRQPSLPVAEDIFKRILTLPLYPDLTDKEVSYVTDTIRKFYHAL